MSDILILTKFSFTIFEFEIILSHNICDHVNKETDFFNINNFLFETIAFCELDKKNIFSHY